MACKKASALTSRLSVWPPAKAESFKKLSSQGGRVCDLGYVEGLIDGILNRVPITRLTDITPLDTFGAPVFAAVSPLASDLTTH